MGLHDDDGAVSSGPAGARRACRRRGWLRLLGFGRPLPTVARDAGTLRLRVVDPRGGGPGDGSDPAYDLRDVSDPALPSRHRGAEGGDDADPLRRTFSPRSWLRRELERARRW